MAGNNPDIGRFRVHPDGRRIAFQTPPARKPPEIWVLEKDANRLTRVKAFRRYPASLRVLFERKESLVRDR
jgi:hypothetical protein